MTATCPECKRPLILVQLQEGPDSYKCPVCPSEVKEKAMSEHTPTPWLATTHNSGMICIGRAHNSVAAIGTTNPTNSANAEFIIRACNSHEKLVEACKAAHAFLCSDKPTVSGKIAAGLGLEAAIALAEKGESNDN